ncbi:MAG: DUF4386 family protein [Pseudolysinimonas sp.]
MDWTPRQAALVAATALSAMAVLAPLAAFGILADAPAGLVMTVVAILDVIVAVALLRLLAPPHRSIAMTAAGLRVAYAAVLGVAASRLTVGDRVDFDAIWNVGLLVFGVHLLLIGALLIGMRGVARVVGALVVVAGLGYLIDAVTTVLAPGFDFRFATFTFVGELALIAWIFVRGGRASASTLRPAVAG